MLNRMELEKVYQGKIGINPSLYPFLEKHNTQENLSDFIDFHGLLYGLEFKPLGTLIIC